MKKVLGFICTVLAAALLGGVYYFIAPYLIMFADSSDGNPFAILLMALVFVLYLSIDFGIMAALGGVVHVFKLAGNKVLAVLSALLSGVPVSISILQMDHVFTGFGGEFTYIIFSSVLTIVFVFAIIGFTENKPA